MILKDLTRLIIEGNSEYLTYPMSFFKESYGLFNKGFGLDIFAEARIASLTDCGRSIVGMKFGGIFRFSFFANLDCPDIPSLFIPLFDG